MKRYAFLTVAVLSAVSGLAQADNTKDMTKEMQAGREFLEREHARQDHEKMSNQGHEGRLSVGKDTSISGDVSKDHRTGETRATLDVRTSHDVGGK